MKNKKVVIGVIVILVAVVTVITAFVINIKKEKAVKQALNNYINYINEKNYDNMYELITDTSKEQINKEDFVKRNKNIYEGIDAANVNIKIEKIEKEKDAKAKQYIVTYSEHLDTAAGEINFNSTSTIKKENKEFKIVWSSSMIFPQLGDLDKVRISTIKSDRGEILDRNGEKLAVDGKVASIGIVPGKLGENKDESISKIAELTGVSIDFINNQLSSSYVKDDTFVPIKKISDSNTELKERILQIPGTLINKIDGRVYPLGKEAAHLIGYVQSISAEELQVNEGKGYNTNSVIGKSGLEKAYEDTLRGIDGSEIYIVDENGNKTAQLVKQDKKDGQNVKLTIDSFLQSKLYTQMQNDKGVFIVMRTKDRRIISSS
ncbi:MAG: hypothetical protein HFJ40_05255 [Clostridia bacterium]|nr:hypothetical protein [Clostridia bacterium]